MLGFDILPPWLINCGPIFGGDDDPTPPEDPPADVPPAVVALTPAEISEMIGGIVSQLNAPSTTDAEKAQLQKDLADAQQIIESNANATASATQKAERDHKKALTDAQRDAAEGIKAKELLNTWGTKFLISSLVDKDGNPKYQWNDIDTVFKLLDHSTLSIDVETGKCEGLEAQLDDLAKKQPFLLKTGETPPATPGATPPAGTYGAPPAGGMSGAGKENKTADDYAQLYPGSMGRLIGGRPQQPGYVIHQQPAPAR